MNSILAKGHDPRSQHNTAMCSNYVPVTSMDRMLGFFGVSLDRQPDEPPPDVYPTGLAPFIRLTTEGTEGGKPERIVESGHFGLVPHFAKELAYGRRTYNARSETVATKPSFKLAWSRGQRCIVPSEHIYEPNWEMGKAVRWRISQPMDVPMGIAGIYWTWVDPAGKAHHTFAMLTVNADGHPVMSRFHKPDDEKRMVVILDPSEYEDWLACSVTEAPRYFRQWMGPLDAIPFPTPQQAQRDQPPLL